MKFNFIFKISLYPTVTPTQLHLKQWLLARIAEPRICKLPKIPLICDCSHSPYILSPASHVITGNLNIILQEHPPTDQFESSVQNKY